MYLIDSIPQKIYSFDYNEEKGDLSNQQAVIDLAKDHNPPLPTGVPIDLKNSKDIAIPDGMCIDNEGKLWVAEFNGCCVCRWDPETGEMLKRISVPARKTTACCFGGPDLDILFVTTGAVYNTEEDWEKYPHSGGVFAVTNLGVKGLPLQFFDDSKFLSN